MLDPRATRRPEVTYRSVQGPSEMPMTCEECGAAVPDGGSCRDNLDALLLLEWQIPGGPGDLAHFHAVGTFNLQHPRSMNFTVEALTGLRAAIRDSLEGRAMIEE